MMRDRDLARITFLGDIPYGGIPATIWGVDGHASIVIEQLECAKVFGRRDVATTGAPPATACGKQSSRRERRLRIRLDGTPSNIMKQHVVDGAPVRRRAPERRVPVSAVAFEHHPRPDLSGDPEMIGTRQLNLCRRIGSMAEGFDARESNRRYHPGRATDRITAMMGEQDHPARHQVLLPRFVHLPGLFPVVTLVRLSTEALGAVTAADPTDSVRPQVEVVVKAHGETLETRSLANPWERGPRGERPRRVVAAVDPEAAAIDSRNYR
jgi:hypothetical protein